MPDDPAPSAVLVVDDDPDIRDVLHMLLVDEGYRVLLASGGGEAFRLATSEDVNLILLDLMMPLFDAADFCRSYRDTGGRAPIILMTAAVPETVDDALVASRADGAILKPFDVDTLLATVAQFARW